MKTTDNNDIITIPPLKDKKNFDLIVAKKLISLAQSARTRNLEFDLSFNTVKKLLLKKKCYFTNKPFSDDGPNLRTIDRLDNNKGYVEGNVVACVFEFNIRKSNLTLQDIKILYQKTKHLMS